MQGAGGFAFWCRVQAAAPDRGGCRRLRRLVPTEKLLALQRDRFRYQFEAMAPLLPDAQRALPLLGRADLESALVCALGSQFLSGIRLLSHAPELEPFAERSAGMIVLSGLMLAAETDQRFVLDRPIAISISPKPISISPSVWSTGRARMKGCALPRVRW